MIITVTLNSAIDKTLSVPNFRLGRRHRTVEQTTMPGGKGVNVARVLKALGQPVIATGLTGGATGTRIVGRPDDVTGPIVAGQAFGAIEILQNGRVVGRVPLVAASSIPAADLEQKAKSWFTSPLPLLLVVALIGGTVLVGRQFRRTVRNARRTGDRPRAA